jgi:multidrug efflux system membrane fusion protein
MKMKSSKAMALAKPAVLFVLAVAASGCQQPSNVAAKSAAPVHLADVALYSPSEGLRYSASVVAFAEASLSFKSAGYVTDVRQVVGADGRRRNIGAGDYVSRGAVLAQIRHQDLQNQLDQAAAALSQAEAQHLDAAQNNERAKALYATHSLTKPDFDQAQANFDSTRGAVDNAKASLRQAQLSLADGDLTAPFSGYILTRNIDLGNLVSSGTVAFTIADISAVKVSFGVPEYALRQVQFGQKFTIHLQDDPKDYNGRVTSIAASADEKNRVFAIEVTVPNPRTYLKPGMIAWINLAGVQRPPAPSVPLSAVVPDPVAHDRYAVFVATEQGGKWTAHVRQINLGETHESDIVVDGVKPGEKVVSVGVAELKDGDPIQVLP